MGFLRKLLGLETRPGEPVSLPDGAFEETVAGPDLPVFIFFFNLWCASCQVMHGLLNEVGPEYIGRAYFYKMDATKSPRAVTAMELRGVPVLAAFSPDGKTDRVTGLIDITELRNWIESHISPAEETPGQDGTGSDQDRG